MTSPGPLPMKPLDQKAVTRAAEVLGVAMTVTPTGGKQTLMGALFALGRTRSAMQAHVRLAIDAVRWLESRDCNEHCLRKCGVERRVSRFTAYVLWCALTGRVLP